MTKETQLAEVKKLFDLGAHLGHKKNRLHPKARKNVYAMMNGTSVIDLTITAEQLSAAKKFLEDSAKEGKIVLVVGTKKTASSVIRTYAEKNNIAYITAKWLPGLLTNFKTIMKNVKKLTDYKEAIKQDQFKDMVKHEKTQLDKAMNKLERLYGGMVTITKRPDILMVIDVKKEKNAVKEAHAFNIPIVGLADTNADPTEVNYPVVANDDDSSVVEYIVQELLSAYSSSFKLPEIKKPEVKKEEITMEVEVKEEPKKEEKKEEVKKEVKKPKKVAKKAVKKTK
ncbi:MAG: 30S ribosomal protein S2 [bacterium]|nr:30S ribosomal protein S2 [bacterium]